MDVPHAGWKGKKGRDRMIGNGFRCWSGKIREGGGKEGYGCNGAGKEGGKTGRTKGGEW